MVKKAIGKNGKILHAILCSNIYSIYSVNMMVKPNEIRPTVQPQQLMAAVPPVPVPPTSPGIAPIQPAPRVPQATLPAPQTPQPAILPGVQPMKSQQIPEKTLTIINASPFHMNVRFEANNNPGVVDGIAAHNSKKISHKADTLVMYSFEQLPSKPITPDMIQGDVVTIQTPQELLPKPVAAPAVSQPAMQQPSVVEFATFPTPSHDIPIPQLPASASSKGPPGYKEVRK